MAIQWGPWTGPSTNQFRVGIDLSVSGTTITAKYYVSSTHDASDSQTLTRTGAITGTTNYSYSAPSGGGQQLITTQTRTGTRGTSYTFGASISGIYNDASPSVSTSITVPALAPSKPSTPTVSAIGTTAATGNLATAPAANGASIVEYQWDVEGNSVWTSGTTRSKQFTSLAPNTAYRVRVRARNSAGWGAWSNWSTSFTTNPATPAAPSGLTVNADGRLDWTRHATTAAPYSNIYLYRRTGTGAWSTVATLSGAATNWTDSNRPANAALEYRLRSYNSAGYSAYSGTATHRTTPGTATSVSAAKTSSDDIAVSWVSGASYPTRWEVWHSTNGGTSWDASRLTLTASGTVTYTHVDPNPSQTHTYRVRPVEGTLTGAYSLASPTVQLQAPPNAPAVIAPSGTLDQEARVLFEWAHSPVDTAPQTAAQIESRWQGSTSWSAINITDGAQSHDRATYGQAGVREFRIRTKGAHPDWGPWSSVHTFTLAPRPTVTIGTIDPATSRPTITLESDQTIRRYDLELWAGGVLVSTIGRDANAASVTLTLPAPLADGTTYTLRATVTAPTGLTSAQDVATWSTDFPLPYPATTIAQWNRSDASVELHLEMETVASEWTDTPNNSASILTENGIEVARNHVRDPRGVTSVGWTLFDLLNQGLLIRKTANAPLPPGHPLGHTHGLMFERDPDTFPNANVIIRHRDPGGLLGSAWAAAPAFSGGFWFYCTHDSIANFANLGEQNLPAETWTFLQWPPVASSNALVTLTLTNDVDATEATAYVAGVIGTAELHEYFDGSTFGPQTQRADIQRRTLPDGPWETIAEGIELDAYVLDREAPIGPELAYRAVTWTDLPSSANGPETPLIWDHDKCPVFIGGGAGFERVCHQRGHKLAQRPAVALELLEFTDLDRPVAVWGDMERIASTFTSTIEDEDSTREDWIALQRERSIVLYRDCTGRRIYGVISALSFASKGGISITIEEAITE